MSEKQAEVAAIADLMRTSLEPRIMDVFDEEGVERKILLAPAQFHIHSLKKQLQEYATAPDRITGTAEFHELDSFIAHGKRFSEDGRSAVFVDRMSDAPSMLAVFDYHSGPNEPRFAVHRARYPFPLSDEWIAWSKQDGDPMPQEAFALWLEEHLSDVADPSLAGEGPKDFVKKFDCHFASPTKLLELSRGLTVHVGARVANHHNLATGEGSIQFETAHTDGQGAPLRIPGAFLLGLPVFRGGALYQVPARLRYRTSGGSISWSFSLHRAEAVFDHAVAEAVDRVRKELEGVAVFYGSPEK